MVDSLCEFGFLCSCGCCLGLGDSAPMGFVCWLIWVGLLICGSVGGFVVVVVGCLGVVNSVVSLL